MNLKISNNKQTFYVQYKIIFGQIDLTRHTFEILDQIKQTHLISKPIAIMKYIKLLLILTCFWPSSL